MKKMKLITLTLLNFKGIKDFTLELNGGDVKVFGDNATGKTTLFDSFLWLLFDKDSQNKKDFEIKTLTSENKHLSGLDHSVAATIDIDGQVTTLQKTYSEKWVKTRGKATKEFSGHQTEYEIDGVPVKKGEYNKFVESIANEEVFKLLTNPSYFNEQLHWEKRRQTLLDIAGDITDQEVINSHKDLEKLLNVLGKRSIEDHRKVIASSKKKINEELERIPVRIDELTRSMPDLSDVSETDVNAELDFLSGEIDRKQEQINSINSGSDVAAKERALTIAEGELQKIRNEHQAYTNNQTVQVQKVYFEAQRARDSIQYSIQSKERDIQQKEMNIKRIKNDLTELRNKWFEVDKKTFEHKEQCECPTCGQALPEDELKAARDKALENFNVDKANSLERITAQGKEMKSNVDKFTAEIEKLKEEQNQLDRDLDIELKHVEKYEKELADIKAGLIKVEEVPAYVEKEKEIESIKSEIEQAKSKSFEQVSGIREEIAELKRQSNDLNVSLASIKQTEQAKKRIEELKAEERELAKKFEELEEELFLTEEFIRTKVNLLESNINSRFEYARFKLFTEQINGGLKETCETLYKGVPYGSGLNNAARINVGLDICRTLAMHYGFEPSVFIDNAESVSKLIDIDAQLITLYVSEQDKTLRVESNKLQEVI
ncbi:AAA family ATPase [Jeotgalibacillus campisalis]|uniref:Nuclease SbcCD subunit C n=1 Tax=Jeotgalibacillus campisalis TaxID=220754 RepID=A0A0C2VB72_9BACL|nr:AAA family ATPase [Jeotgalibacillus campisalis]KIL46187.1 hypothetical protein KR50_28620 [Jeotgalibacillus campisalis]